MIKIWCDRCKGNKGRLPNQGQKIFCNSCHGKGYTEEEGTFKKSNGKHADWCCKFCRILIIEGPRLCPKGQPKEDRDESNGN